MAFSLKLLTLLVLVGSAAALPVPAPPSNSHTDLQIKGCISGSKAGCRAVANLGTDYLESHEDEQDPSTPKLTKPHHDLPTDLCESESDADKAKCLAPLMKALGEIIDEDQDTPDPEPTLRGQYHGVGNSKKPAVTTHYHGWKAEVKDFLKHPIPTATPTAKATHDFHMHPVTIDDAVNLQRTPTLTRRGLPPISGYVEPPHAHSWSTPSAAPATEGDDFLSSHWRRRGLSHDISDDDTPNPGRPAHPVKSPKPATTTAAEHHTALLEDPELLKSTGNFIIPRTRKHRATTAETATTTLVRPNDITSNIHEYHSVSVASPASSAPTMGWPSTEPVPICWDEGFTSHDCSSEELRAYAEEWDIPYRNNNIGKRKASPKTGKPAQPAKTPSPVLGREIVDGVVAAANSTTTPDHKVSPEAPAPTKKHHGKQRGRKNKKQIHREQHGTTKKEAATTKLYPWTGGDIATYLTTTTTKDTNEPVTTTMQAGPTPPKDPVTLIGTQMRPEPTPTATVVVISNEKCEQLWKPLSQNGDKMRVWLEKFLPDYPELQETMDSLTALQAEQVRLHAEAGMTCQQRVDAVQPYFLALVGAFPEFARQMGKEHPDFDELEQMVTAGPQKLAEDDNLSSTQHLRRSDKDSANSDKDDLYMLPYFPNCMLCMPPVWLQFWDIEKDDIKLPEDDVELAENDLELPADYEHLPCGETVRFLEGNGDKIADLFENKAAEYLEEEKPFKALAALFDGLDTTGYKDDCITQLEDIQTYMDTLLHEYPTVRKHLEDDQDLKTIVTKTGWSTYKGPTVGEGLPNNLKRANRSDKDDTDLGEDDLLSNGDVVASMLFGTCETKLKSVMAKGDRIAGLLVDMITTNPNAEKPLKALAALFGTLDTINNETETTCTQQMNDFKGSIDTLFREYPALDKVLYDDPALQYVLQNLSPDYTYKPFITSVGIMGKKRDGRLEDGTDNPDPSEFFQPGERLILENIGTCEQKLQLLSNKSDDIAGLWNNMGRAHPKLKKPINALGALFDGLDTMKNENNLTCPQQFNNVKGAVDMLLQEYPALDKELQENHWALKELVDNLSLESQPPCPLFMVGCCGYSFISCLAKRGGLSCEDSLEVVKEEYKKQIKQLRNAANELPNAAEYIANNLFVPVDLNLDWTEDPSLTCMEKHDSLTKMLHNMRQTCMGVANIYQDPRICSTAADDYEE